MPANPVPGLEEYIDASYWFIKTIPLGYAVDLIALSIAMLATAQLPACSWKLLPLYNIPLLIAGFTADYHSIPVIETADFSDFRSAHARIDPLGRIGHIPRSDRFVVHVVQFLSKERLTMHLLRLE